MILGYTDVMKHQYSVQVDSRCTGMLLTNGMAVYMAVLLDQVDPDQRERWFCLPSRQIWLGACESQLIVP